VEYSVTFPVNKKVLLIFAKQPKAGETKTRLCPPFTPEEAAQIYEAMLQDLLTLTTKVGTTERWLCYVPSATAADYFKTLAPNIRCLPQHGEGLGARLINAFASAFAAGATSAVIIGTDSPDLPTAYIDQAFNLLETTAVDVVFGPATDGGYYLVGARMVWPEIFTGIPWSTAEVLPASLNIAAATGISTALLPEWYDIDTLHDLRQLVASAKHSAPLTRRTFAELATK
jgi:rSAM/selenodomain-associated transferase 1